MKPAQLLQIIECIVVIYCGIKVAAGPHPMRWRSKWAKPLFCFFVLLDLTLQIANTFLYKFSGIGIIIHSIFIFILIYTFYYINFWELFAHNFLYWFTFILTRYLVICIGCHYHLLPLYIYIETQYHKTWQYLHIISMVITILIALWLLCIIQKRQANPLIVCKNASDYKKISALVIVEESINEILFNSKVAYADINDSTLLLMVLILWSFFCISIIVILLKAYFEEKNQKQTSELNYSLLKKQYEQLQDTYNNKRRELHDQAQFSCMLKKLLQDGDIERTLQYLTEKESQASIGQKNKYTGISIIDLMLDYKIKEAQQYKIIINVDLDIYFCPLDATDMCILLGNLLDNAIEATKNLSNGKRMINIKMRNPNNFFLLEISNPYEGERRKKDGHYLTTKADENIHGFGLISVERIVNTLDGVIEIDDINNTFTVFITIFPKQGQKNQNIRT